MVIIVPTLIFVILWVIFSIYHNFVSSTIPETVKVQINPINPSFDTKTIDQIKNREKIDVIEEIKPILATPSSKITPQPTPTKTTGNNQASTGGTLNQ